MKIEIVVCLLVVLACHEATCYEGRPYVEGNCSVEDYPESERNQCIGFTCNKDEAGIVSSYGKDACERPTCIEHTIEKPGDPTKMYPACCPEVTCE